TLATAPSRRAFMPSVILRIAGRFFSRATLSLPNASASAFAPASIVTRAGLHSTFALTWASQFALHSALTFGGSTLPSHFGSLYSTEQPPEQVPSHLPWALI